jgi:hypothetical protein
MNNSTALDLAERALMLNMDSLDVITLNTLGEALSTGSRQNRIEPKTGLGTFDPLPLEIVLNIVLKLDFQSALHLRHVNRRFMVILDSLLLPNITRSILAVEYEEYITPQTLYKALATTNCRSCGQPGEYIYLLSCHRVCFPCFTQKEEYIPLNRSNAQRKFDLSLDLVETLPCLLSRPGTYTPDRKIRHHRMLLVDYETARQAGIRVHGGEEAMVEKVKSNLEHGMELWTALSRRGQQLHAPRPRTEEPLDALAGNPLRFMAIVKAPLMTGGVQGLVKGEGKAVVGLT